MPFLTQDKTNRKFIGIVLVLAVIIGGGIFAWQYFGTPKEEVKAPEEKIEEAAPEEIEKPYIKVISPNGGEKWVMGGTYKITWNSGGLIEKVRILLLEGNREVKRYDAISNTGTYSWTIPQDISAGSNYKIDIMDYSDINTFDQSDNYFSIVKKNETADWETYRNEEYGYEIKYPQDWKVESTFPGRLGPGQTDFVPGVNPQVSSFAPKEIDLTREDAEISIYVAPPGYFTCPPGIRTDCISGQSGEIIVDKTKAMFLEGQTTKYCPPEGRKIKEIYLCRLNNYFRFSTTKQQEDIFNQMLSTFRFLNSNLPTALLLSVGENGVNSIFLLFSVSPSALKI